MFTSIKRSVNIRVVAAILSVFLLSAVTTVNVVRIDRTQDANVLTHALLDRAQKAEVAHYKWAANLSSALYTGSEFTGSKDYTACVLGQWLYADMELSDSQVEQLRSQVEPLHRQLHESADVVLAQLETDPDGAREYYQQSIQGNLTKLVGLLDQVIERAETLSGVHDEEMSGIISLMHAMSVVFLLLALVCMVSLVLYVMKCVIQPILIITEKTLPLQQGELELDIGYSSKNELGTLAKTIEDSIHRIHEYVLDINRVMGELSGGNFDVGTSMDYIGDFRTIEESLGTFTEALSGAMDNIGQAEKRVAGHAEQLSSGAQALAQGATEQASAVQQLYATVADLTKSSEKNVAAAAQARNSAQLTSEQVTLSSKQMEEMVLAMQDIAEASEQIGKIIATIENIAFQTNILALNAAVEAARAGSAGKGFAVVADEVRNLASKSDEAAKATKDLIENSISTTARGNRIVDEVSVSLKKAQELVTKSNTAIAAITEAISQEAEALTQVSEGIGQISSVVQTNSASSEESAAVSSELFNQVSLLQAETSRFTLKKGSGNYYAAR